MRYIEITVAVAASDAETACALVRDVTGGGASIEAPFEQLDLESDAEAREGTAMVRAYVAEGADGDLSVGAREALAAAGIAASVTTLIVQDEDWANAWKEHFHVERFGERIVVAPSWRSHEPVEGDIVLRLDPGMAFGTGQHETTRMCLESLERVVKPGAAVLDLGCGSGILSIAAALLGASRVLAVDVDADCARITAENAAVNGLERVVRARTGSLGEGWPFAEAMYGGFDVIVANIIARVILELTPEMVRVLAPGGRLIVSGVIAAREAEVVAGLTAAGLQVTGVRAMGEWRCIEAAGRGKRRAF